jgi:hypothetical protein
VIDVRSGNLRGENGRVFGLLLAELLLPELFHFPEESLLVIRKFFVIHKL